MADFRCNVCNELLLQPTNEASQPFAVRYESTLLHLATETQIQFIHTKLIKLVLFSDLNIWLALTTIYASHYKMSVTNTYKQYYTL